MLKRFSKAFFAQDNETLLRVAIEEADKSREKFNAIRHNTILSLPFSIAITHTDCITIVSHLIGNRKKSSSLKHISSILSLGATLATSKQPLLKNRIILSYAFSFIPYSGYLTSTLNYLGVSSWMIKPISSGVYSAAQVYALRKTHGFHTKSVMDFILTTSLVSGVHFLSSLITKRIMNYFPIIPPRLIGFVTCGISSVIVQRFSIYGITDGLNWMKEKVLAFFIKYLCKEQPDLPIEADIPQQLKCSICHDLLKDPVESLGFYFCGPCMREWLTKGSQSHPMTGESLSDEMLSKSAVMSMIVNRYRFLNQPRNQE